MSHQPPARQDQFLDVQIVLGQHTIDQDTRRVSILLKVEPANTPRNTDRALDYRMVIDRSGSMSSSIGHAHMSRLEAAKTAVSALVRNLGAIDQAMLCSFDDKGRVDVSLDRMTSARINTMLRRLASMETGNSTEISSGVRLALAPQTHDKVPTRLILLTDGQSHPNVRRDHQRLLELADRSRKLGIPWLIYGTGVDYDFELLQQLQARIGHGSFCKHVLDMTGFEAHLQGELAFHRGIAIEGLKISGQAKFGQITKVLHFCPSQQELPNRDETDQNKPLPRDYFTRGEFHDAIGCLDHFRGQQLLIEMEVPRVGCGVLDLIEFKLEGRQLSRGLLHFSERVSAQVTVADDSSQVSSYNPEVLRVYQEMSAARAAKREEYERAAQLYQATGNMRAATDMQTLHQMSVAGHDRTGLHREAHTMTGGYTSMCFTEEIGVLHNRDSDSQP